MPLDCQIQVLEWKELFQGERANMKRRKFLLTAGALSMAAGLGAWYWPNRWRYIVIHHSAGNSATIESLQQVHRERQPGDPIDAIPYHFVIGNGNGIGMGEVASDWRKDMHIWGTHVSARNKGRNFAGIGICLVGNFETCVVPEAQFSALLTLTRSLMAKHRITADNVGFHGRIDGESTRCPGRLFPYERFHEAIRA